MTKIKTNFTKKIIFNEPDFSRNSNVKVSPDAKDLILKLLEKNQKLRIKISQIRQHPFFNNFDFNEIYEMKVTPPINLELSGENDYKYIDPGLEHEKAEDSLYNGMSPIMMKDYKDFTYVNNFNLGEKYIP